MLDFEMLHFCMNSENTENRKLGKFSFFANRQPLALFASY